MCLHPDGEVDLRLYSPKDCLHNIRTPNSLSSITALNIMEWTKCDAVRNIHKLLYVIDSPCKPF